MQDSPIECVGNLWATKASVDAFLHLAPLIGRRHLQLFKDAVATVFDTGHPQAFVDDLIRSLPGLSSDHRLMASLGQDLALLAEAS